MINKWCIAAGLALILTNGRAQTIATLEVNIPTTMAGMQAPVAVDLNAITFFPDSVLSLVEVKNGQQTPTPFQIAHGESRTLHWLVAAGESAETRVYQLIKGSPAPRDHIEATKEDGALTIRAGGKNLLSYQYETMYPPEGVDTAYKRSAFFHPLWSPKGQVLTRIQPPDHYHHYGIWNPWTRVLFEGDTVDFWNLADRQGTVRFAHFVSVAEGPVFAGFEALQEHVAFKKGDGEKVALNELQSVRVYKPAENQDYFIVDFIMKMNCASESPFNILEYRYAGFGWRATEEWTKENSEVLTSEGKVRREADGSKARWCIVQGEVGGDYAGAVMMSYPANYNHPEPLRIWPEQGRGDMFANFSPTKDKDWTLTPGQSYTLKYRLLVFNGRFTKEKAESAWQNFAAPPKVTVKLN